MNITKLPSGHYRIRYSENGKRKAFTVNHKPSQTEALRLIAGKSAVSDFGHTFETACRAYIDDKKNILSPSTIRGYEGLVKQISPHFKGMRLENINLPSVQSELNDYAKERSSKSIRNMSGFIMGVLRYFGSDISSPKIPKKNKTLPYIPTKEEVIAIYRESRGSKYEVALLLAGMGLRRSEICALTIDDLYGNTLTINKALVQDHGEKWQIKDTKTTESERVVTLPDYISELIRKNGCVFQGYPSTINSYLHKLQDKLNIPRFSLHKMRHFFASYMHEQGFSDKQIQDLGGWKTSNVMDTVYKHALETEKARKNAADCFGNLVTHS